MIDLTNLYCMKKAAIIIPVFNVDRYINECLKSVLSQTHKNFIIFAVDDGSVDNSSKVLDNIAETDDRVYVIHQKNLGVSAARNRALDLIEKDGSFDYVFFLDADDYLDQNFLQLMIKAMECNDVDYAVCAWRSFDKDGFIKVDYIMPSSVFLDRKAILKKFLEREKNNFGKIDPTYSRFIATKGFRAKSILGLRFNENLKRCEDQDFFFLAWEKIKNGVIVPEFLYYYRLRKSSLSHSTGWKMADLLCYESWYINFLEDKDFPRMSMLIAVLDLWWAGVRQCYVTDCNKKELQLIKEIYDNIRSDSCFKNLSKRWRVRFFTYSLGAIALKLSFALKKRRVSNAEYEKYFE